MADGADNAQEEGENRMNTKIKICGVRRETDVNYVNICMPDYAGFVFAESRRRVTGETAARLRALLDPRIQSVGVFVNEPIENIAKLCEDGVISMVQLHGSESEAYILSLKRMTDVPVIKAISPSSEKMRETIADFLLLDGVKAGSGRRFDWALIDKPPRPFFLAGGLTPENIGEAIRKVNPYAADVSSGTETAGVKDLDKIRAFVDAVRESRAYEGTSGTEDGARG
jgi:phosphoribosylanthranilate isomerase